MRKSFLKTLADWCVRHNRLVLFISLLCTAYSIFLINRLTFDTTFIRMLPEHSKEVDFFREVTRDFGSSTDLYLLVEFENFGQARSFIQRLKPELEKLEEVREVQGRFIDTEFMEERAWLYLSEEELHSLQFALKNYMPSVKKALDRPRLSTVFEETNEQFISSLALYTSLQSTDSNEQISPFLDRLEAFVKLFEDYGREGEKLGKEGLAQFVEESFLQNKNFFRGRGQIRQGYLLSQEGNHTLVRVKLAIDALQTELGMSVYGEILSRTRKVARDFPALEFGYTGHFAIGYEDQNNVVSRIKFLSLLSLVLVLCLFVYIDRTFYGPLLVGIPLLFAVLWTFGFVRLSFGFVSITSAIFGILLFGLGVDFAIHLLVRFHEERYAGLSTEKAIEKALTLGGAAILTGGVTTSLAFFAMNVSDFKAAKHLGTTSGWGILSCLVAMLIVLPALMMFTKKLLGQRGQIPVSMDIPLLDNWVGLVCRFPYVTLVISLAVTIALGASLMDLKLQYDLEKMISKDIPSLKVKKEMEEIFHLSTDFVFVLAGSVEEARRHSETLAQKRAGPPGEERFLFSRVASITDYIPQNQKKRLKIIHSIVSQLPPLPNQKEKTPPVDKREMEKIKKQLVRFRYSLSLFASMFPRHEGKINKIKDQLDQCHQFLSQTREKEVAANLSYFQNLIYAQVVENLHRLGRLANREPITLKNLPSTLKDTFVSKDGKTLAIYAYPRNSVFDRENIEEVIEATRSVSPRSTGHMIMVYHFIYMGLQDFPKMAITVIILVMILLFIDFGSPIFTLLALVPIGFGAFSSLGILCLLGEPVNILTLLSFPLIFGIGIDDGVHVIHRYREESEGNVEKAIASTGKAILLTSMTTMASFGILLLTSHHGFIGMGKLILLGVGMCFVTSVTVLPALLIIGQNWGWLSRDEERQKTSKSHIDLQNGKGNDKL